MGVIAIRVSKAKQLYREGRVLEAMQELIDTADKSVNSAGHRTILDDEVKKQFGE